VRRLAAIATALLGMTAAGCGGDDADITVYSGRQEELVGDLFEQFEDHTGLKVEVRYGDSAELAATLMEEGRNSPADVFFAQDAGSLGSVSDERLLRRLPPSLLARVPARFHDPAGRWVATSARVRVVAYNTEAVREAELPDSVWDYAGPRFRGRIGLAPTNASFQAMVSAMRLAGGEGRTRRWLEAIKAKDPRLLENNIQTLEAVANGEVDVGFVNHYYLYEQRRERPDVPVANHYMARGDPGALINAAGAGLVAGTDRPADAQRLVSYLVSAPAQRYFARRTAEYPVAAGVPAGQDLPPLGRLQGPDIRLGALGPQHEGTLRLLNEVGLTP
jgi:iron(III) transport system substrate-binding protein